MKPRHILKAYKIRLVFLLDTLGLYFEPPLCSSISTCSFKTHFYSGKISLCYLFSSLWEPGCLECADLWFPAAGSPENLKENLTSAVVFSQGGPSLTSLCPVLTWLSSELSRLAFSPLSFLFSSLLYSFFLFLCFSQHGSPFSISTLKPADTAKNLSWCKGTLGNGKLWIWF